ncbi:zinc fingers and homeoboxes protein 2-like [Pristis pectinata]|uniref:zinc fingers and homeoboxes protein 2-like n=1 Tax=Pristis pectinata TaxID=685728 RepID=UPI00223DD8A2|nr:zinc fingers and homeoboxes protein 2-like [Pristis pectinata]XP_051879824.1 zinc fingers and homeoboxes protein 2-like [Pristis pectinata]
MASKRKSTTPCMVRAADVTEQDPDLEIVGQAGGSPHQLSDESCPADNGMSDGDQGLEKAALDTRQTRKLEGGYECKYCTFESQDLNEFTEHVDTIHPNVILNPFYVCAVCNFTTKRYDTFTDHNSRHHPGESNFKLKLIKRSNQTILEQTVEDPTNGGNADKEEIPPAGISISKTPIMKIKNKADGKRINVLPRVKDEFGTTQESKAEESANGPLHGGLVVPETVIKDGVAHVMPSIQPPPNINLIPKVMIPMHGSKYNAAMDINKNLIGSFNKFPYPTQAELSWLTAVSKHPEEQIKMWFSTQRLKHGISWAPEEVEEARKMMFNGTIQTPTITVVPAQVPATTKGNTQQVIQTGVPCQLVGQTGIVLTQVANGATVSCSPIALTMAGSSSQAQSQKRGLLSSQAGADSKRANVVQVCQLSSQGGSVLFSPGSTDVSTSRKKTKEQMAKLKASFAISQFPNDDEVFRLMHVTKLSRSEIKKWFSDNRYRTQKGHSSHASAETTITIPHEPTGGHGARKSGWNTFSDFGPQKFKEKSAEQLKVLEESFQYSSFPTDEEKDRLRVESKLTRREIDAWFSERRKLRDSLEGGILDMRRAELKQENIKSEIAENVHIKTSHSAPHYLSKSGTPPPSGALQHIKTTSPIDKTHKKSQEQLHILKSAFARTQWPTVEQYDSLVVQSGLPRNDIVRWFGDNRYAIKNGNLKWLDQYQRANSDGHNGQSNLNGSGTRGSRGHKTAGVWSGAAHSTQSRAGKSVLLQYYLQHRQLKEEDLDELVSKSNMSYEQVRDWFAEKQTEDAMDTSESNSRDGQCSEEDENEDWSAVDDVNERDDYVLSEFTGNWAHASQCSSTGFNELDSESMSAENSNI